MAYFRSGRYVTAGLIALAATLSFGAVHAQDFPNKSVTIIVPYPPGGGNDTVVRTLEPALEKALGTDVIIKNVAGGGGAVGLMQALASKPDGYTVTVASNAFFTLQGLGNVDFKYEDFDYIARLTSEAYVLVVRKKDEWKDLASFVESVKADSTKVKLGFAGVGTSSHIMTMAIADALGIEPVFVPYDGGASSIAATMGGHIDGAVLAPSDIVSAVEGGLLEALGTTGKISAVPDIPTFVEQGYDMTAIQWRGLAAPAGLDEAARSAWEKALEKAVKSEEFEKAMQNMGSEVAPLYGKELMELVDQMAKLMLPLVEKVKQ